MSDRTRVGGVALALILLVAAFGGTAAAHGGDDGVHHHDGMMGAHDGMGWGLWFLWPVLVLLVVGVAAYLLVSGTSGAVDTGGDRGDSALTVLRERYARGEIDDEEFERRRRQLQSGSGGVDTGQP